MGTVEIQTEQNENLETVEIMTEQNEVGESNTEEVLTTVTYEVHRCIRLQDQKFQKTTSMELQNLTIWSQLLTLLRTEVQHLTVQFYFIVIFIKLNFDALTQQNNELTTQLNNKDLIINELRVQVNEQKNLINDLQAEVERSNPRWSVPFRSENVAIKQDVEFTNKRNLMLQNYLVAANETIPEDHYVEKVK